MATFIDLTNRVLRRCHEVEVATSEFSTVRGSQKYAKDAVNDAIRDINTQKFEWPFNAAEHTQLLSVGQEEYSWPSGFKSVEWNSFRFQPNASLGVGAESLDFIERDEWYRKYREDDDESAAAGLGVPKYVFPSHGSGFGVSPSPNQPFTVIYKYFTEGDSLQNATDSTTIPDTYSNVIVDGAMYYYYLNRDNPQLAGAAKSAFDLGVANMTTILINNYERVRDTRVKF